MARHKTILPTIPFVIAAAQQAAIEQRAQVSEETKSYRRKFAKKAIENPGALAKALDDTTRIRASDTGLFPS